MIKISDHVNELHCIPAEIHYSYSKSVNIINLFEQISVCSPKIKLLKYNSERKNILNVNKSANTQTDTNIERKKNMETEFQKLNSKMIDIFVFLNIFFLVFIHNYQKCSKWLEIFVIMDFRKFLLFFTVFLLS